MDNIQKTLLGVISVAGTIAFLTPSTDPLAPTGAEQITQASPPPETDVPPAPPPLPQSADEVRPEIEVKMGEPTIDGQPIMPITNDWQPNQGSSSAQPNSESAGNPQLNVPGFVQPSNPYGIMPNTNIPGMPMPTNPNGVT